MASKQLGKLRQWAGEVISSRDKTVVTEEFRELEYDIELRRQGLWRLHVASGDFHHFLDKKKESEALEESDKLLPIDALGIVMIRHGEEFGDDSAFGTSLVSMGRAHCKIATLQETFAMTFEDTYLASVQRMEDEIKEYQVHRKKLESRRLSLDSAISKLEKVKQSKKDKEKERKEAEDEHANAKSRYEETAEDVRARMYAIQENEVAQLRDLTAFLDLEMNFVEQYLEVLRDVKSGWVDEATVKRMEMDRPKGPMHMFTRKPSVSQFDSVRSTKSTSKGPAYHGSSSEDVSEDEDVRPRSRGLSLTRRKSEASIKAPSRPTSRASRKRSGSAVTAVSDTEKEKEGKGKGKGKAEKTSRKMSVAGWASTAASAVSSVTGRGKKDKDKDNFAALRDDFGGSGDEQASEDERAPSRPSSALSYSPRKPKHQKSKSAASTPGSSPQVSMRIPKSVYGTAQGKEGRKIVVALHDFNAGSSDELSFRAGDQITVVSEVLDGWWMGQLGGRRGLFPTTYTEHLSSTSSLPFAPPFPQRPPVMTRGAGASAPPVLITAGGGKHTLPDDGMSASDDEHPFGDHQISDSQSPTYGRFDSGENLSNAEEDDKERLIDTRRAAEFDEGRLHVMERPILVRRATDVSPAKKPPPPPPRRMANNNIPGPPPVPDRSGALNSKSSQSSSGSFVAMSSTPTAPGGNLGGLARSPFDSPGDAW